MEKRRWSSAAALILGSGCAVTLPAPCKTPQSLRRLSDLEYIFGLHLVFRTLEGVNLPRNTQRVIVGREINT